MQRYRITEHAGKAQHRLGRRPDKGDGPETGPP